MWIVYGLMSAIFAAIASIFDKTGVTGIDSNLATAVRTSTVVMMAWAIVFTNGTQYEVAELGIKKGWIIDFRDINRVLMA